MSSKSDLIVFDEEFVYARKYLNRYARELIGRIERFSDCLETLLDLAVKDEAITQELRKLIEDVKSVRPLIEETVSGTTGDCSAFISDIDKADRFLY